ncbi:CTM1 [Candida margitis]|uniref:CTM1 n=1 Tax=Candida margitis TaxID=1775924 RepID=UPI002226EA1B|nr:CTM1 [Candida margitis]KAI5963961.1 CTM1 [Candida margitis]
MSIEISKELRIPGVDNNEVFTKWIASQHIKGDVVIDKSFGVGLYYRGKNTDTADDPVILRVPSKSALNMDTLLDLLTTLKSRDKDSDVSLKESDLIVKFLEILNPGTETIILLAYLLGFEFLRSEGDKTSNYYLSSPLRSWDIYLDVLLSTKVFSFDDEHNENDPHASSFTELREIVFAEYEDFITQAKATSPDFKVTKAIPFDKFFQLFQAVRSRSLEIPKEVEGGNPDSEFQTNVTLVPILDFANHNRENNAYFDVDRENNDIVLKLKKENASQENPFEVSISYHPIDTKPEFYLTYGFKSETQL